MHGQSVNIIDRGMWVMMVMALSSEACSAHAVVTVTLLRLGGAVTVIFAFIQINKNRFKFHVRIPLFFFVMRPNSLSMDLLISSRKPLLNVENPL